MTRNPGILVATALLCAWPLSSRGDVSPDAGMILVPASTFEMGQRADESGSPDELPRREITLAAYEIAKFEVTNGDYAKALNWAQRERYIDDAPGDIRLNGRLLKQISENSEIMYINGLYMTQFRDGHDVADHPVAEVSWYGAVAYANWLSEMRGLEPCYDLRTWKLRAPVPNGYRLPTEAEWERAAGWDLGDEPKRWIYGFGGDATSAERLNHDFSNPLEAVGMLSSPKTSPVGYFNGRNPGTVDSPSPVGCYDMSGNVYEWCNDWFDHYAPGPQTNPFGPAAGMNLLGHGQNKILRGGGWGSNSESCRVSNRGFGLPEFTFRFFGFRLARNAE